MSFSTGIVHAASQFFVPNKPPPRPRAVLTRMDDEDLDMAQNEEGEEGEEYDGWHIDDLFYGRRNASIVPSEVEVRQLVQAYYRYWFEDRPLSLIHI